MSKLYEITQKYDIIKRYIAESEVEADDFKLALDEIEGEFADKAESIVKLMANIKGDVEIFKKEEARIYDRRKAMENHHERLKEYLFINMQQSGLAALKAGTFSISVQKNAPSVNLVDEDLVPKEYFKQRLEIDKKSILDDLKAGKRVEGAEIIQKESLRIR